MGSLKEVLIENEDLTNQLTEAHHQILSLQTRLGAIEEACKATLQSPELSGEYDQWESGKRWAAFSVLQVIRGETNVG